MRPRVDDAARIVVESLGRRLREGTLVLDGPSGRHVFGGGPPQVTVTIRDPRCFAAILRHGSVGLSESYMQGMWDCDDLTALVRILIRNLRPLWAVADRMASTARPLRDPLARLRGTDRLRDRRNIRAHYDIGNDFYELMLDETMTYSCAVFADRATSLADAQREKLDRICRKAGLGPNDRVVEIGTGWGSFAAHAASLYGCRVTTATISAAQQQHAVKRIAEAGLADSVDVVDRHYRELRGTYDKLVSIEMIEAVDWRDHDRFFSTCRSLLRPGGTAVVQAIVIADESYERAKHHDDFIKRHIFPGGCLPSIASLTTSAARARLQLVELDDIGADYPETLRRWRANLQAHDREVAALGLGDEFRRTWDLYLTYCEAAFLERHVSDVQIVLRRRS